jgi:hypothetical protein
VGLAVLVVLHGCSPIGSWDVLENLGELGSKRMKLLFDNTAQSSDLHSFPLLVVLNPARTSGYDGFAADGRDVRFVDPESPATLLDYEIELWDPAGNSYIWVRVPKIDGASDRDHIWMYFDNPKLDSGRENPQGVWRDYELVYHFGDNRNEEVYDSSPGAHHGEPLDAMPVLASARIGLGFPSSDSPKRYVHTHYREDLVDWTVEAWVRGDSAPQVTGIAAQASGTLSGGQWYYLAGVYKSNTPKLQAYRNGVLRHVRRIGSTPNGCR